MNIRRNNLLSAFLWVNLGTIQAMFPSEMAAFWRYGRKGLTVKAISAFDESTIETQNSDVCIVGNSCQMKAHVSCALRQAMWKVLILSQICASCDHESQLTSEGLIWPNQRSAARKKPQIPLQ